MSDRSIGRNLLPKYNDMITNSLLLEESYRMWGTPCEIILAKQETPELGYEKDVFYDEDNPIKTNLLIQTHPTPKLLKQLGWDFESDEDSTKPMLVSLPRYLSKVEDDGIKPDNWFELKIERFSKVIIDWDYSHPDRIFQVTNVSSNMFNPIFYFIKLAPWREKISPDPGPLNDPNLQYTDKEGQFKHISISDPQRSDEIKVKY